MVHADICLGIDAIIADTDGKGHRTDGGGGGRHGGDDDADGGGGGGGGGRPHHSGVFKFFMAFLGIVLVAAVGAAWFVFLATDRQPGTASTALWTPASTPSTTSVTASGEAAMPSHAWRQTLKSINKYMMLPWEWNLSVPRLVFDMLHPSPAVFSKGATC
jgi:hypothetical protein